MTTERAYRNAIRALTRRDLWRGSYWARVYMRLIRLPAVEIYMFGPYDKRVLWRTIQRNRRQPK